MGEIRLERLGKRFGSVEVVNDVNLEIGATDFLVLLGPSGCGKTTVLRMIAGLLPPSTGRIVLDGRDITHEPAKRRDLAMVFQNYALYPHMTVAKNIAFPLTLRHMPKAEIDQRVRSAADMLELGQLLERKPKELSGGQRQRVALGRAVVRQPKAFLMDEPLSNLDAKLRTATRVELTELHRRLQTTFVYVTHDQVEAMTMATRIAIMNNGLLEQVGTPTEVYDTPASTFVAGFIGAPPMNLIDAELVSEEEWLVLRGRSMRIPLRLGSNEARDVVVGVRPEHLRPLSELEARDAATPRFDVKVLSAENLGSEEVAFCDMGGEKISVRIVRPSILQAGMSITLTCDPKQLSMFSRTSGRRLEWMGEHRPIMRTEPALVSLRP